MSFSLTSGLPSGLPRARAGLTLLAAALLTLGGCATASNPFEQSSSSTTIEILVQNQNFSNATVYAVRAGQSIRLGIVNSQNFEVFSIPWPAALPLRVEARFLGGLRCSSQEILVNDGDRITVELPANLELNGQCPAR